MFDSSKCKKQHLAAEVMNTQQTLSTNKRGYCLRQNEKKVEHYIPLFDN